MLRLAFTFLFVAILSGILGYSGVAGSATDTAKLQAFLFLFLLFLSLIIGTPPRKAPPY